MATKLVLTDEQLAYIKDNYANNDTSEMAKVLSIKAEDVRRFAISLGVKKSKSYLAIMRKKNGRAFGKFRI